MLWVRLSLGLCALVSGTALLGRALAALRGGVPRPTRKTPLVGAALGGALAAVVLQSSSLCVVGLAAAVDGSGLALAPAWAAVAGANVGTTLLPQLTAWEPPWLLLALAVLPALAAALAPRTRRAGACALGALLLISGFRLLASAASGGLPAALGLLHAAAGSAPAAFLAGLVLTAALFSSGLTIAVAQGLAAAGAIRLEAGIAFVCGANIGTTADVLLAALGAGVRGRSTAAFHLAFNLLCAGLGLVFLHPLAAGVARAGFPPARGLAHVHLGLNLACALAVLPLLRRIARVVERRHPHGGTPAIRR